MAKATQQPKSDGGYKKNFLGTQPTITLPTLNTDQKKDRVTFGNGKSILEYIHYSVVMCKSRQLAFYTAVNIDGTLWQDNSRSGDWRDDPRIKAEDQLGQELYSAKKSDFDRGHLVRREDPEWGTKPVSVDAGKNTFWFPNCTPQHKRLNQQIWAELESNILHTGAENEALKISVFTGPVLSPTDGTFVTKIENKDVQIPNLFWKVVVWKKSNGKTYAVGFLQSQEKFLLEAGIIKKQIIMTTRRIKKMTDEDIFEHLKFKDGKTYQVKIEELEKLTGLKFDWSNVIRPYKKVTPTAITGRAVPKKKKIKKLTVSGGIRMPLKVKLSGLVLG